MDRNLREAAGSVADEVAPRTGAWIETCRPTPAARQRGSPRTALFNIHDCIVLALDIADNQCPFPEEAYELLREALAEMKALLDGKRQ